MSTREDLRNLCRRRLSDTTYPVHWSDVKINQWINDAIADISNYFPRQATLSLSLTSGTQEYSLSATTNPRAILSVEYPDDQEPPEFLEQRNEHDKRGLSGKYYAVRGVPPATIWLGPNDWTTGDTATVTYLADHSYPSDDSDTITIPDKIIELVVLFVRMVALQEVADEETQDPRTTTLIVGTLGLNANRAEREYRTKITEYQKAIEPGSQVTSWQYDEHDRIY
jgi:hypothetical protein